MGAEMYTGMSALQASYSTPLCCFPSAAFRLMGAEMYTGMSALQDPSHVVERGIALHKMIRAVTMVGGCRCEWVFRAAGVGPRLTMNVDVVALHDQTLICALLPMLAPAGWADVQQA